ncbi:MAG: ATP-dependent metallopeptidase FtsH/Yme1/Tma family protein, partial [Pseudomonadota bacterium]
MNNFSKNLALWIVIGVLLIALFNLFQNSNSPQQQATMAYSDFLADVDAGQVREVQMRGQNLRVVATNGEVFNVFMPEQASPVEQLIARGVKVVGEPIESDVPSLASILISWFPMLLLIGVWLFVMRQMQGGGGKAMGFGKSKAKMLTEKHGRVTFDDVAGIDEAKDELDEIVEFLRNPQKFSRLGGKIPKGALLVGPPGTGKTLLARAVAGEAGVPFFTISGSDFVEMFVGVGASRVRDMFEQAKKNA